MKVSHWVNLILDVLWWCMAWYRWATFLVLKIKADRLGFFSRSLFIFSHRMSLCKHVLLGFLWLRTLVVCRKSDYKQIIFSDFVKDELEKNFKNDLKRADGDVLKLYEDYLRELELTNLTRLQPERVSEIF